MKKVKKEEKGEKIKRKKDGEKGPEILVRQKKQKNLGGYKSTKAVSAL